MKILLIQPPVRDFYFTAKRSIPYGLISIASSLRSAGFEVELIDALATSKSKIIKIPIEMSYLSDFYSHEDLTPFALFNKYRYYGYSFEHLGNLIERSRADIVGVSSLFTAYSDEAIDTARLVRKKLPGSIIVMGGHHPTAMPENVMAEAVVDFVIRGEGEDAFTRLVVSLKKKWPLEHIKGLVFRKNDGSLHCSPSVHIENLDALPLPAGDLYNHKFYGRKAGASMVLTASRGCPMKCTYCCVAAPNSVYRKRSVDSVFSEIEKMVEDHGVRFIDFEDENLTLDRKWFFDLLKRINVKFSHLDLEFRAMNGLFPPSIDEEMIFAMKESGFKVLNLSLCTTSKPQLKRFNRPDVKAALERIVDYAKKQKMETVCYVIAGAPGQAARETVEDLIYLDRLGVVAGVSIFYPAPGSLEYERTREKGLLPNRVGLMRSSAIPVSDTTSRLESVTLLRLGRILNFIQKLRADGREVCPVSINETRLMESQDDRYETGYQLIQAFLHDGNIRGLHPDGRLYCHVVSEQLTKQFIQGLGHSPESG